MHGTMLSPGTLGRGYSWLAGEIRARIDAGDIRIGERLPTTRELGLEHGVSRETARRAIKALESEGLVVSEPRHGYRVQARANDPDRGLPIAFVVSAAAEIGMWDDFHRLLFAGLQSAAAERGWSLLAVGAGGRSGKQVMEQLRDCRACGMVLDAMNADLLDAVASAGLPVVMMDSWEPEMRLDAVVQDSFQGAMLATQYLIDDGHERIAWLGPVSQSVQSRERFGGYTAAMAGAGLRIRPELARNTAWDEVPAAARKLLTLKNRPTAVLGLWTGSVESAFRASREADLTVGKDVEVLGWTCEEDYERGYRALFGGGRVPPTMVWSIAELARMTVARLAARRQRPEAPARNCGQPAGRERSSRT
ncbi:MAG: GntR family transcriptional regulator [Planctomycetota bacterium]|jgi:DNA-binding LacI/PurR family transcriptional regulator